MRALRVSFLLLVALAAASAADLKVKVVDPQSVAVSGAQVSLFSKATLSKQTDAAPKASTTSAEGIADFGDLSPATTGLKSWLRASLRRPKRFPLLTM